MTKKADPNKRFEYNFGYSIENKKRLTIEFLEKYNCTEEDGSWLDFISITNIIKTGFFHEEFLPQLKRIIENSLSLYHVTIAEECFNLIINKGERR